MAETKMQLVDWFDDLCVRFIINLPQEELESVERICFQVEEAQWFYEDFMFRHCPLLASFSEYHHLAAFDEFLAYKTRVPVRGAILLNHAMDKVLLVRGWKKGANWSFPRGKINKDEKDLDCAIREVYEETGYDIMAAGLVPDPAKAKYIEVTMREQHMKLYVFRGVPEDTMFQPRTRKEISKIEWYKLSQLPGYHKAKHHNHNNNNPGTDHDDTLKANKFYMVAPFLQSLKKWIAQQRRLESRRIQESSQFGAIPVSDAPDYYDTEDNDMQKHLQYAQKVYDAYAEQANNQPPAIQQLHTQHTNPPPQLSPADAASELKRLLSVGQQPRVESYPAPQIEQQAPPEPGSAANLLSMLRQSGSRPQPTIPQDTQSRGIFDQRASGFAHDQHPQYQRLPEMSADNSRLVDPSFAQLQSNQPAPRDAPVVDERRYVDARRTFAPVQALHSSRPDLSREPTTSLQQSMAKQNQATSQQAPAPYQRTGDPHFARETPMLNQQGPAIPSASNLPAPKLSNHALNLLNTFRSGTTATSTMNDQPPVQRPTVTEVAEMQANPHGVTTMPKPMGHQHSESRSRQVLGQASSGLNIPEPPAPKQASSSSVRATNAQHNAQHNALLDLFRKPSQPQPTSGQGGFSTNASISDLLQRGQQGEAPAVQAESESNQAQNQQGNYLAPDPVELSALPSPGIGTQRKQLFDPKDGTMKEHVPQPRVLAKPPILHKAQRDSSTSPLVSATMSGPPNVPEFGTVRRKHRTPKQSVDQAENVFREQEPTRSTPIQILRRPASPKDSPPAAEARVEAKPINKPENRRPVTPSTQRPAKTPTTPAELKGSTPKAFQPQILRRPPQSPSAPSAPLPEQAIAPTKPKPDPRSSDVSSPPVTSATSPRLPLTNPRSSSRANGSAAPQQPLMDRRSSNTAEQKQALLSLFAKPKTPASTTATSPPPQQPTTSTYPPSSNASTPLIPASVPSTTAASLARIAAVQSPPPPATEPPAPAPIQVETKPPTSRSPFSPVSSAAPDSAAVSESAADGSRRGSALQSPISEGDRGFLLSYLEGFAKGSARR